MRPAGWQLTNETREKIRAAKLGSKNPAKRPEVRAKMSAAKKGKPGHPQSIESRAKTGAAARLRRGPANGKWKGGKYIDSNGYVWKLDPNHPFASANGGYVLEHRLVMEAHLGRTLLPTEVVHHINSIKDDNRIENLMLFSSASQHTSFHKKGKKHDRRN